MVIQTNQMFPFLLPSCDVLDLHFQQQPQTENARLQSALRRFLAKVWKKLAGSNRLRHSFGEKVSKAQQKKMKEDEGK
jgi:ribosomal protein S21